MFEVITARELADEVDADDEGYVLVDTRPEDSYESWHVPGAVNVPFGAAETLDDEQKARIDELADGRAIHTICGKGATSTSSAARARRRPASPRNSTRAVTTTSRS
ncbi:rhodanese-like domain-containing protein [Halomicrococcus gelatinilyticus]|uniref:rhodanese-like domain-containing protein n=1 Tax=Halomicrococcus gelatinilyticus TaxID=1702103 RepID=UPI002E11CA11